MVYYGNHGLQPWVTMVTNHGEPLSQTQSYLKQPWLTMVRFVKNVKFLPW